MLNIFISKIHNKLILEYSTENGVWASSISEKLNIKSDMTAIKRSSLSDELPFDHSSALPFDNIITISKCFKFEPEDVLPFKDFNAEEEDNFDSPTFYFILGDIVDGHIFIKGSKLLISKDVYLYDYPKEIEIKWFKVSNLNRGNGSVFYFLEKHMANSSKVITIGNTDEYYLRWDEFISLVDKFPTNYEVNLYVASRVTEVIKQYTYIDIDYQEKLNRYREKRNLTRPPKDFSAIIDLEITKYELILDQLKDMLKPENIDSYTENIWQQQIAKILLLIYPQYVAYFEKVRIKDSYANKKYRELDFVLVNNSGNIDILEIKKPTLKGLILRPGKYRANYVPSGELSGTIMQAEKYVINLIKWGTEGEDKLNNDYRAKLPQGIKIQINSPKAILILGMENDLNEDQARDLEIIKRKYSNITDIITYDDLLKRLKNTISALKQKI